MKTLLAWFTNLFKKEDRSSKCWCECGHETLQDPLSKIYDGGTFTNIICSKCNRQTTWDLDAPVPWKISSMAAVILFAILLSPIATAQTPEHLPTNIVAAGASYNPAGSPKVAGNLLYARLLSNDMGTYSFTFVDVLPLKSSPSAVSTSISTGFAKRVYTLGKAHAYLASGVGIQTDGKNMGWDWNGGVGVDYPIKNGWGVMPIARFDKGSATENYGYRFILSVMLRFGK